MSIDTIEDPFLQPNEIALKDPNSSEEVSENDNGDNKRFLIALYSFLLLVSSVGNSVYSKRMMNKLPNYPYFLSQFTTLIYLPIFGVVVAYTLLFTKYITPDQVLFPKSKFAVMGALDSLAGVFTLFGGIYTSGGTQGLLNQAVVPVTMAMSYLILKERYRPFQILGASIILGGVVVVLVPKFVSGSSEDDKPLFNMIYLISVLPTALSSVYKEIAFGDIDLDVNYLQFWVAIFQFLFGFLLIPLNTFQFLGPSYVSWSQLPLALWNGMLCLAGYNSIITGCGPDQSLQCDNCAGSWVSVVIYLVFNCGFNIFIILVLKHGGAALLYIILTLRLPIINMAFSWRIVQDPPDPLQMYTLIGLGLIIIGLVCYRMGSLSTSDSSIAETAASITLSGNMEPVSRRAPHKLARAPLSIRTSFYTRIGVVSSPRVRDRTAGQGQGQGGSTNSKAPISTL